MLRRSGKGIITRAKMSKPSIHIKKRKDALTPKPPKPKPKK